MGLTEFEKRNPMTLKNTGCRLVALTWERAVMEFDIASKAYKQSEWIPRTPFFNPQGVKYVKNIVLHQGSESLCQTRFKKSCFSSDY